MRVYKTTAYDASEGAVVYWSGSQEQAGKDRKAMRADLDLSESGKPATEQVDVPTDKNGLIEWLNFNCNRDNG